MKLISEKMTRRDLAEKLARHEAGNGSNIFNDMRQQGKSNGKRKHCRNARKRAYVSRIFPEKQNSSGRGY